MNDPIDNTNRRRFYPRWVIMLLVMLSMTGCGKSRVASHKMVVTGYCGCSQCCGWERGSWMFLKLNFWNRYVSNGPNAGKPYSGLTASGTTPHEPRSWPLFSRDGTVAADTRYYPFGTRLYIPGYGYGRVEDRGSAIKGPNRLDIYFDSHDDALEWGRRTVYVRIID